MNGDEMATTVNAANLAIGFDVSKLRDGMNLARGEISKVSQIVRDSISPVDKYNQQLTLLKQAYQAGAVSAERMAQAELSLAKKHGIETDAVRQERFELEKLNAARSGSKSPVAGGSPVGSSIGKYATGFLSIAAVSGSLNSIQSTFAETARRIDEVSDRANALGMSYKDLIVAQRGFGEISGMTTEEVTNSLQKMQINLSAAKMGTGGLADSLKALQLDPKALTAGTSMEAIKAISTEFAKIKEPADQLNFALDLFGKSGVRMVTVLRDGGEALREMEQHLQAAGVTLSDIESDRIGRMNDNLERANDYAMGLANKFTVDVSGAINVASEALKRGFGEQASGQLTTAVYEGIKRGLIGSQNAAIMDLMKQADEMLAKESMSKQEKLKEEQKQLDELQKQVAESEKLKQSFDSQVESLQRAREELQLGKAASLEQQAIRSGLSQEQASELRHMQELVEVEQKRIEAIKQQADERKRAEDEMKRARDQSIESLVKEGEALEKQSIKPMERLKEEMARLDAAAWSGAISQKAFDQGTMNAAGKYQSESNPNNVSTTLAPALRAGTVEAYKFIAAQNEKSAKTAEQIALAKDMVKKLEEANNIAKSAPRLAMRK